MSEAFRTCLGVSPVDSPFRGGANFESAAGTDWNPTYQELLKGIQDNLRDNKCSQEPQLSSSYKLV